MNTSYIPHKIIAGDTLKLSVTLPLYPASDGWVLMLYLRGKDSLDVQSTPQDDSHLIQVAAAATASWAAGPYRYSLKIAKAEESYTVCTGNLTIADNPLNIPADFDPRPHAQKVLDAINALLEGRADTDQEEMTINNRTLKRTPIPDLLALKTYYLNELRTVKGVRPIYVHFRDVR